METTAPAHPGPGARRSPRSRFRAGTWPAAGSLIEPRSVFLVALVAVSYGITARLGLLVTLEPQHVAIVWPAAGIALGALLVSHPRRWVLVVAAVTAGLATAIVASDIPSGMALGLALAHVVEPLVAAVLLRRLGFTSLGTLRGVGLFAACAGIAAPMVGAAIGASSASAASGVPFVPTWIMWALADAGGALAIAPVVLVVRLSSPLPAIRWRLVAEAIVLALALMVIAGLAFLPIGLPIQVAAYPSFLLLVLAAVRFGLIGAALATLGLATFTIAGTIGGFGPIAHLNPSPPIQVGQAQVFVGVAFLTAFVTAAAVAERRVAAAALADQMRIEADRASINERLTSFAHEISQSLEEGPLFQHIVHAASQVVRSDIVQLSVAAPDGAGHRVVAAVGAPNIIGRTIAPGEGITGEVIRSRRAVTVARQGPEDRPDGWEDALSDPHLAVTSAPILRSGAVVGTLTLARTDLDDPFRPDEVRALAMMCGLSGLALANAVEFGRMHERSVSDELTGVPNRRYFTMAFQQLSAQRLRQAPETRLDVSAIMFDLDHFGALNKERGHATGDVVLATFGGILANRLRRADVVARYGGEEFVALLVGTDRAGAMRVAEEVRSTFAAIAMKGADGDPIRCTVSAGVATIGSDEPSLDGVLGTADVALSMAKRAGRNQVASA